MKIKQYQVDAFTSHVFKGNPAAVCPLDSWLEDEVLQAIAEENNLSETAFFVETGVGFHLRWFTPVAEVDLCGHATLAAAHILFNVLGHPNQSLSFDTRSGKLMVERRKEGIAMSFPASFPKECRPPAGLIDGLGQSPTKVLAADDYIAVFDSEAAVRSLSPDLFKLRGLDLRGVAVTAPGERVDFVSRFFAPKFGIPEDPVTGSAHCSLTPYWASKFRKKKLKTRQISKRGGDLLCHLDGSRVLIIGQAVTFSEGTFEIHA